MVGELGRRVPVPQKGTWVVLQLGTELTGLVPCVQLTRGLPMPPTSSVPSVRSCWVGYRRHSSHTPRPVPWQTSGTWHLCISSSGAPGALSLPSTSSTFGLMFRKLCDMETHGHSSMLLPHAERVKRIKNSQMCSLDMQKRNSSCPCSKHIQPFTHLTMYVRLS